MRREDRVSKVPPALESLEPRLLLSFAYTITELGTLGGDMSWAHGLNDSGQVVGAAKQHSPSETHAYLWTQDAGMLDLGAFGGPTAYSTSEGINNLGQVVGRSETPGAANFPFIWTEADGMRQIFLPLGREGQAEDINDAGQVVGYMEFVGGGTAELAFLWTDTNGDGWADPFEVENIGSLGGGRAHAMAINNAGHVVGLSNNAAGDWRGFFYDGAMMQLPTLGGDTSRAMDINNAGQVVGYAENVAGDDRAFIWEGGVMRPLGSLGGDWRAGIRGDLYPHITVEGTSVPAGKDALGTVTAAGVIPGRIMVRGNVKSITAGCLFDARLLIGFDAGLGLLEPCTLKSLTLKGTRFWMEAFDSFFRDATLAAYTIGKIKFAKPPHEASGLVRYHELGKVQNEPLPAGDAITWDLI